MVLVVGATGELGSRVAKLLAADGERVRALTRETSDAQRVTQLEAAGVETVQGDLRDPASLAAACRGVEAVVSTASCIVRDGGTLDAVDRDGHLALIEAAEAAGAQRFVFVSFAMPEGALLEFPLRSAKQAVEERLRNSTLEYTVLQPSPFMESWLSPLSGFDHVNGVARLIGDADTGIGFVATYDVARATAAAVRHPGARNRTVTFGGPERLSYRDAVRTFEGISGRRFQVEVVSPDDLRAGYAAAPDDKTRSLLALRLGLAYDWPAGTDEAVGALGLAPEGWTTVEEYAHRVSSEPRAVNR